MAISPEEIKELDDKERGLLEKLEETIDTQLRERYDPIEGNTVSIRYVKLGIDELRHNIYNSIKEKYGEKGWIVSNEVYMLKFKPKQL